MRDAGNILDVARLSPDYMGFIFYKGSSRFVGNEFKVPEGLSASIGRVGVFVNESATEVMRLAARHNLKFVQLHGNEEAGQCAAIRSSGLKVIKVFSVGDTFDFEAVKPYRKKVDFFMFDTKGMNFGGTGAVFDWTILRNYKMDIPFFLSGGLSPANVSGIPDGDVIHAIDVNSGVEKSPGLKDVKLLKDLIAGIPA